MHWSPSSRTALAEAELEVMLLILYIFIIGEIFSYRNICIQTFPSDCRRGGPPSQKRDPLNCGCRCPIGENSSLLLQGKHIDNHS